MNETTVRLTSARPGLEISAKYSEGMRAYAEELTTACMSLSSRISGERRSFGERRVFVKGGPLPKSAAARHRARRLFLGAPLPSLSEFLGAQWLRKRLFQTPQPLAAIEVHSRKGMGALGIRRIQLPVAQLFVSEEVPDGVTFDEAWGQQSEEQRLGLCRELGNEVGRMHALHFLHGDLYPRNVLVDPAGTGGRSLWFIDSWAGGPTAWRNGSLRTLTSDFGTWLSEAPTHLDGRYLEALLDAYLRSRSANGRPIVRFDRWLSSVQESRRRELRRLERQRFRLRAAAFPQAGLALPQLPNGPL